METIGSYLKRERELRKIPLEVVSQSTKISLPALAALEADNLKVLPGQVFAKGFVRSYAKAVGLNVDEVLLHLEEHLKVTDPLKGKSPKINWLKPNSFRLKSWMLFVVFFAVVLLAAYLSAR